MRNVYTIESAKREIAEQQMLLASGDPQYDDNGNVIVETCICGECGLSWNDALITSWTPAPSARCPFEYEHEAVRFLRRKGIRA